MALVWPTVPDPFTPNRSKFRFIFFYKAPSSISIYASMNPIYAIKGFIELTRGKSLVVGFGYQTTGIPTARIVDAPTIAVLSYGNNNKLKPNNLIKTLSDGLR